MAAITNGAELVKQLRDQGCPESKLAVARAVLTRIDWDEKRVATAEEVIAGLEESLGSSHKTVAKAKVLAETGKWEEPVSARPVPIEDQLAKRDEKKAEEKAKK